MTPFSSLATALRHHARDIYHLEAAAELIIAGPWLHQTDFTRDFLTTSSSLNDGRRTASIDWPAAIASLDNGELPCSGGERRMLRLTASLANGIPVDLREALTGIDNRNTQLLIHAVLHTSGRPHPARHDHF
ncbi:MAG: hypothetical protein QOE23_3993 [Pseudonocardiales bacterium]|jgi:hypothetical protein|nr:hypothetical protein [Pseudonocardiales bacterium]